MSEQTCPDCRIIEAAGSYRTKGYRDTEQGWLHPAVRSEAQQRAARAVALARSRQEKPQRAA